MATKKQDKAEEEAAQEFPKNDAERPAPPADAAGDIVRGNAAAYLSMSDEDLVAQSTTLGVSVENPDKPTKSELSDLRKAADEYARSRAGEDYVDGWIERYR